jgi:hypothetical protein
MSSECAGNLQNSLSYLMREGRHDWRGTQENYYPQISEGTTMKRRIEIIQTR